MSDRRRRIRQSLVAAVALLVIVAGSGCAGLLARSALVRFVFAADRLLSVAGNAMKVAELLNGVGATPSPPPAGGTRVVLEHAGPGGTTSYHYDIHLDDELCFLVDGAFVDSHDGNTVTLELSGEIVVGVVECGLLDEQYSATQVDEVPEFEPEQPPAPEPPPASAECPTPPPGATDEAPPLVDVGETSASTATYDSPAPDVTAAAEDAAETPAPAETATDAEAPEPLSVECPTSTPTSSPSPTEETPTPTGTPEPSPTTPSPTPTQLTPSPTRSPTRTPTPTPTVTPSETSGFSSPSNTPDDTLPPLFGD